MRRLLPVFLFVLVGCSPVDRREGRPTADTSAETTAEHATCGANCAGCGGSPECGAAASAPTTEGATTFGAPFDESVSSVTLASLLASPESFAGQMVRTSGRVARVCPRMGCWLELATESGDAVRVPMAGHAFFVPRDLEEKEAEVVGRVVLAELTPAMRAHLESEGARVTGARLSIEAVSVRVR